MTTPTPTAAPSETPCPVCNGNDGDMPCAYPTERPVGCLRAARLSAAPSVPKEVEAAMDAWYGAVYNESNLPTTTNRLRATDARSALVAAIQKYGDERSKDAARALDHAIWGDYTND